jgi:manganese/zinc/iron transport system permease protein
MSLLGDAISHAVLPGLVVAVLLGAQPGGIGVLFGATAAAMVTVWFTRFLCSQAGLWEDASVGVSFTTLFAAGVLLVTLSGSRIDLDPGCVLYGILEMVPFDTVDVYGWDIPRAFLSASFVLLLVSFGMWCTWRWQLFTAFDCDAAKAAGVPTVAVTTGLLVGVSLATVTGFVAVGAILVVAMLVVPAATAERLVHRLHHAVWLAVVIAVVGAVGGYLLAWKLGTSAAGMMAVVLGVEYVIAILVAPDDGVVARLISKLVYLWRVQCEDRLASLWRAEESGQVRHEDAFGGLVNRWLCVNGQVRKQEDDLVLTPQGRLNAEVIVRSHRLWETWLGKHVDLPVDHLHPPAEWIEHHLGEQIRKRIEKELGNEDVDPHGSVIPREKK